jgi:CubicO group peptidase (beta-lactamase class C family)
MRGFMQKRSITGGSLAVTRQGKLVHARGYTFSDDLSFNVEPTSLFRIASLTKPVTSTALFRLVEQGKVDLSTKIASVLKMQPSPGEKADPRLANVTLLNVLQHLGGWDRDKSFDPMSHDAQISRALGVALPITQANIISYTTGRPLDWTPGTNYAYSNYGYLLLGRVIEAVSGKTYGEFIQQEVFAPLGIKRAHLGKSLAKYRLPGEVTYRSVSTTKTVMDGSGQKVPEQYGGFNIENMDSHGAWVTSAVDLVRFATTFDNPNASPLLESASISTMFAAPPVGVAKDGSYYGCGWQVTPVANGVNTWHGGSLAGTDTLLVRRWDGLDWAVFFNQRDDASDPQGTTYGDIDGLLHKAADSVRTWPAGDLFKDYQLS